MPVRAERSTGRFFPHRPGSLPAPRPSARYLMPNHESQVPGQGLVCPGGSKPMRTPCLRNGFRIRIIVSRETKDRAIGDCVVGKLGSGLARKTGLRLLWGARLYSTSPYWVSVGGARKPNYADQVAAGLRRKYLCQASLSAGVGVGSCARAEYRAGGHFWGRIRGCPDSGERKATVPDSPLTFPNQGARLGVPGQFLAFPGRAGRDHNFRSAQKATRIRRLQNKRTAIAAPTVKTGKPLLRPGQGRGESIVSDQPSGSTP